MRPSRTRWLLLVSLAATLVGCTLPNEPLLSDDDEVLLAFKAGLHWQESVWLLLESGRVVHVTPWPDDYDHSLSIWSTAGYAGGRFSVPVFDPTRTYLLLPERTGSGTVISLLHLRTGDRHVYRTGSENLYDLNEGSERIVIDGQLLVVVTALPGRLVLAELDEGSLVDVYSVASSGSSSLPRTVLLWLTDRHVLLIAGHHALQRQGDAWSPFEPLEEISLGSPVAQVSPTGDMGCLTSHWEHWLFSLEGRVAVAPELEFSEGCGWSPDGRFAWFQGASTTVVDRDGEIVHELTDVQVFGTWRDEVYGRRQNSLVTLNLETGETTTAVPDISAALGHVPDGESERSAFLQVSLPADDEDLAVVRYGHYCDCFYQGTAVLDLEANQLTPVHQPMDLGMRGIARLRDGELVIAAAVNDYRLAHSDPSWSDRFFLVSVEGEVNSLGPFTNVTGPVHTPVAP